MAEFSRSLAIVIGINQYGNGISFLKTAVNDAKEVARILEEEHKYDKVWRLLDEQASLQGLQQFLEQELPKKVQKDDRVLFYFAGHGIALNGEDGPEGFLIPQDAKLGDTKTYLPMSKLQASLSQLPCRHFLGILDCCFAGAFRWSSTRKLVPIEQGVVHKERYDRFITDPAWQVITSAAYDQTALDSLTVHTERGQVGNHSPFAAALIEALSAGKADLYPPADAMRKKPAGDGVTTATDLYVYLRDRIEPETDGIRQRQTPGIWSLKKHDKGEYIFLTPGHILNLPPAPPLDESKNPYRGLQSFEEEQSDLFFGRQALTAKLREFVRAQPLSVVLGASGSGKSSLVKAGLIPDLKDTKAEESWQILAPMRPGESPFMALGNLLGQKTVPGFSVPNAGSASEAEMLMQYMAIWSKKHPGIKLLLVIDQFEELITLCRDEKEREQFQNGLTRAVTAYPKQLRLVLTLRSDFEPQFQEGLLKAYWKTARFIVPPMTRAELREAIEEPASKRVMYFQSDDSKNPLVDQIIDEVAEMPGALPLLSFTLSELYLKYLRRQEIAKNRGKTIDRAITEADYTELGGVARSLTQRADQEYEKLVWQEPEYDKTIQNVMLRMVAVGGGELARRRVPLSEFKYPPAQSDRVKTVIQRFSDARLLVEGQDPNGKPYVEPAHDALVRGWQKLLTWKQEHEESLTLQRRLTPAAEEWKEATAKEQPKDFLVKVEPVIDWLDRGFYRVESVLNKASIQAAHLWKRSQQKQEHFREKPEQFLWNTNPYLDVLHQQLESSHGWFNQVESEFVQESVLQRRQNTSWRWRIATGVILGLSALSIAALIGQRNAQIGQAQAFRQSSEANLLSKQELDSLVNALQAGRALEGLLPFGLFKPTRDLAQVRQTLQKTIDQNTELSRLEIRKILEKSQGGKLASLSFGENDRLLATIISKRSIELWDFESQKQLGYFEIETDGINTKFSPNGKILAIEMGGKVRLWNVLSKQLLVEFPSSSEWDVMSFSPDSTKFLVVGSNRELNLWNLESREWVTASVRLPKNLQLTNVIWSSGGEQLMLSDFDGDAIYTWRLNSKKIVPEKFKPKGVAIGPLILSPDRQFLVNVNIGTGKGPGLYKLWDLTDRSSEPVLIKSFTGHYFLDSGKANSVIWSHDGRKTATIDSEGIVRVWNFHKTDSEQNSRIGTDASNSKSNRVGKFSDSWGAETQEKLEKIKEEIKKQYSVDDWNSQVDQLISDSNLTFSPDRTKLAIVANWQQRVFYFWDLETGKELKEVKQELLNLTNGGQRIEIQALSFSSADEGLLAIAAGIELRLWDLKRNQWFTTPFQGDTNCNSRVERVAFSPNGQLIATRGGDASGSYVCVRNLAGHQLARFKPPAGLDRLSFSPDSTLLFSTPSDSNQINHVWKIESFDELMKRGCSLVGDYLNASSSVANESNRQLCDR